MQHDVGVVGIWSAVLDPAGVFKTGPFKTFSQKIGGRSRGINRQHEGITGCQRAVAHRNSNSRGAGLPNRRRDSHGPIGAAAAEDDVGNGRQGRIRGSSAQHEARGRRLHVSNREADWSRGSILIDELIRNIGNRRWIINRRNRQDKGSARRCKTIADRDGNR